MNKEVERYPQYLYQQLVFPAKLIDLHQDAFTLQR